MPPVERVVRIVRVHLWQTTGTGHPASPCQRMLNMNGQAGLCATPPRFWHDQKPWLHLGEQDGGRPRCPLWEIQVPQKSLQGISQVQPVCGGWSLTALSLGR